MVAVALSATALTFSACSDDKGDDIDDIIVEDDATYTLSCNGDAICDLKLDAGKSANVILQLSKKDKDGKIFLVGDSALKFHTDSALFKMQSAEAKDLDIKTSELGQVNLQVTAGDVKGSGIITVTADEALKTNAVEVKVIIEKNEDEVIVDDLVGKITVKYDYAGAYSIASADAIIFAGKTCSEVAPSGLNATQVAGISAQVGGLMSDLKAIESGQKLSDIAVTIDTKVQKDTVFAVVGRGTLDGKYQAYGCVNNIAYDGTANILLNDVFSVVVVDPDPDPTKENYAGKYQLVSSFDALSILPRADVTGTPQFTEMLLGDWISWTLNFLSDPEKALPEILTKQILPLLLNADWFRDIVAKILPGFESILTPEVVDNLLETLGVKQLLTDLLSQVTDEITWWNSATSTIEVINEITQNFTLVGNFENKTPHLNDNNAIAGIGHSYDSLWYHNGGFEKCLIGKEVLGIKDKSGKLICAIPLKNINDNTGSTINGAFSMTVLKTGDGDNANIAPHTLEMAYGKLIYGVIMEFLPLITGLDSASAPKTISGVMVYYIGQGLVGSWNKQDGLADEDKIDATLHSCAGVGTALSKYLKLWLKDKPIADLFGTFANPATLSALCETGVKSLDALIDKQIGKLSVSSDNVSFKSDNCPLYYNTAPKHLAAFGQAQINWKDANDGRCIWNMSVTVKEKTQNVKGKFSAVRISNN